MKKFAEKLIQVAEKLASESKKSYVSPENFLKPEDAKKLEAFFKSEQNRVENLVTPDVGTSVLGNGISVYVVPSPRHKKPQKVYIFRNPWTQAEQPRAIEEMISRAEKKFPEYKGKIQYEWGRMD
jgi:hypothetical protein